MSRDFETVAESDIDYVTRQGRRTGWTADRVGWDYVCCLVNLIHALVFCFGTDRTVHPWSVCLCPLFCAWFVCSCIFFCCFMYLLFIWCCRGDVSSAAVAASRSSLGWIELTRTQNVWGVGFWGVILFLYFGVWSKGERESSPELNWSIFSLFLRRASLFTGSFLYEIAWYKILLFLKSSKSLGHH